MTIPQTPVPLDDRARPGRSLAGAVAVFLGGYLLLASLSSPLVTVSMTLFATLTGRGAPQLPQASVVLYVLQFLFAIVVVVAGLLLANGSIGGRLVGAVIATAGSLVSFAVLGMWANGLLPIPGGRDGIPFQAVFVNPWFATVLAVGVAWLLARRARLGWLSLLGTVVLVPVPAALAFAGAESGTVPLVMFLLSAIVGAGIVAAGRPWRD